MTLFIFFEELSQCISSGLRMSAKELSRLTRKIGRSQRWRDGRRSILEADAWNMRSYSKLKKLTGGHIKKERHIRASNWAEYPTKVTQAKFLVACQAAMQYEKSKLTRHGSWNIIRDQHSFFSVRPMSQNCFFEIQSLPKMEAFFTHWGYEQKWR